MRFGNPIGFGAEFLHFLRTTAAPAAEWLFFVILYFTPILHIFFLLYLTRLLEGFRGSLVL